MAAEPDKNERNELRDWIKANGALVSTTSFMITAAVFSRGLGSGKSVLWLMTCFVLLALILMQEVFESFPKPGNDSDKLKGFKWVLGSAMANLMAYWVWLAYKASNTWLLGVVFSVLGLNAGEWLRKRVLSRATLSPKGKSWASLAIIVLCGLLGVFAAKYGVPRAIPIIERDFIGGPDAPGGGVKVKAATGADSLGNSAQNGK